MKNSWIRPARINDIPLLVETVLEAEKSGGDHAPIARLFGLNEEEARGLIATMFEEEIEGCEFSLGSFLVVDQGEGAEAAVAGWVEGANEDGMSAQILRANLIGFTFPARAMDKMRANGPAVSALAVPRNTGTLQIEYVHVAAASRGKGYAQALILQHMACAVRSNVPKAQVQVFGHNKSAISLYIKLGFERKETYVSDHPDASNLLPHNEKWLMERKLP